MRVVGVVLVSLLACAPVFSPVQSQPVTPDTAAQTAVCELHVWPAAETHSSYTGWFHGGAVDGDKRGFKGYPNMYTDALDLPHQVALLNTMDWRGLLGVPTMQVTIHDKVTGADDDRTRVSRATPSASPCYREIIIKASVVEAATFSSRSLRIIAISKNFEGAGSAPKTFSTMTADAIVLPEKSAPDFDTKMRTEAKRAFVAALRKFTIAQSFH